MGRKGGELDFCRRCWRQDEVIGQQKKGKFTPENNFLAPDGDLGGGGVGGGSSSLGRDGGRWLSGKKGEMEIVPLKKEKKTCLPEPVPEKCHTQKKPQNKHGEGERGGGGWTIETRDYIEKRSARGHSGEGC